MLINILPWLLPIVACLHIFEEFVWPGGFPNWYRQYRPEWAASMTSSLFIRINAIFLGFAFWSAFRAQNGDFGMWLVVSGIQISNALWHLNGTIKTRKYSPGTVTGLTLYWPLALCGATYVYRNNLEEPTKIMLWYGLGCCYQLYSNWQHRTRANAVK